LVDTTLEDDEEDGDKDDDELAVLDATAPLGEYCSSKD